MSKLKLLFVGTCILQES